MQNRLNLRAPAKINLRLKVTGQRPDGYHTLEMIMAKVDLADEIQMEVTGSAGTTRIESDNALLQMDASNLIWKAAEALRRESGKNFGLQVFLKKRIPVAAGLGGGSSDAATTLLGLNSLLGLGWSREKLREIGIKLGADVPFFLEGGPQEAKGIGEVLTPILLPEIPLILINPGFPLSTPQVFGWFDDASPSERARSVLTTQSSDASYARLENDLEQVVLSRYPVLAEIKSLLSRTGALGTLMSGSGATVFGTYDSVASRDRGFELLVQEKKSEWWVCRTSTLLS